MAMPPVPERMRMESLGKSVARKAQEGPRSDLPIEVLTAVGSEDSVHSLE